MAHFLVKSTILRAERLAARRGTLLGSFARNTS
jgi:hypothetical protein